VQDSKLQILVVDDEPSLRTALSISLRELGYDVRSAEDGFSALAEMRNATPQILISDLNMPGMSGFELLSVVRRRFPTIPVIAMSGAFPGNKIPDGVAADCFYQKGSGIYPLLKAIATFPPDLRMHRAEAPIWIAQNGYDLAGEAYITMTCPECLRVFPLALGIAINTISSTVCVHCGVSIPFAVAVARSADHTLQLMCDSRVL
jgi:CheY-like chemotaxis protein